jgi:dihydroorotase-like cyclic amidohydrolase
MDQHELTTRCLAHASDHSGDSPRASLALGGVHAGLLAAGSYPHAPTAAPADTGGGHPTRPALVTECQLVLGLAGFGEGLVTAGLGVAEALATATSGAAEACGLRARKGRLAPGYDADLLVVDGDLETDVTALHLPRSVLLAGPPVTL